VDTPGGVRWARGWQGVAADRLATRFRVPRRAFLSLDYGAKKPFWEWQPGTNEPGLHGFSIISSSFGISFQILRALVYKPHQKTPLSPWERAGGEGCSPGHRYLHNFAERWNLRLEKSGLVIARAVLFVSMIVAFRSAKGDNNR